MGGFLVAGARAIGGTLARSGVIRGTVGKLLGGGAKKVASGLPAMVNTIPSAAGKILRAGGAVGTAVAVSAAGSSIAGKIGFGSAPRKRRRINHTNVRALKRALRRVEGFEKLVRRSFTVKDIKPRKARSCR